MQSDSDEVRADGAHISIRDGLNELSIELSTPSFYKSENQERLHAMLKVKFRPYT